MAPASIAGGAGLQYAHNGHYYALNGQRGSQDSLFRSRLQARAGSAASVHEALRRAVYHHPAARPRVSLRSTGAELLRQ